MFFSLSLAAAMSAPFSWPHADRTSVRSTALAFFPVGPGIAPVRITKVAVRGNAAVITFEDGTIEGRPRTGQLLLERFDFGWQTADLGTAPGLATADLRADGLSTADALALLGRDVPATRGNEEPGCAADTGTRSDTTAVRRTRLRGTNAAIGPVTIAGGYALVRWWGNGGGEDLYARRGGGWVRIGGGGGAFDSGTEIARYGVPRDVATRLLRVQHRCGPG